MNKAKCIYIFLCECIGSVQWLSCVWLFVTPWTATWQASLSITNSRAYPNSCLLCWCCHSTIPSSVVTFASHLQSFPALGSFLMNWVFSSGGQSTGISASASVLPMNIPEWFPLGLTGLISLLSKGLSRVFSKTTVQKHRGRKIKSIKLEMKMERSQQTTHKYKGS